jgi:hypothetical protein
MAVVDKLEPWIDILQQQPADTGINLCPSELIRLLFDLRTTRKELMARATLEPNTDLPDFQGACPECGTNWNNGDIVEVFTKMRADGDDFWKDKTDEEIEKHANNYGWTKEKPKCFSRIVGVEIRGYYDGVAYWSCPDCKHKWHRFKRT